MYLCAASVFWVLEKVYLYCGYNTVITPCITDSFPSRYAVIRTHPLYLMFKASEKLYVPHICRSDRRKGEHVEAQQRRAHPSSSPAFERRGMTRHQHCHSHF